METASMESLTPPFMKLNEIGEMITGLITPPRSLKTAIHALPPPLKLPVPELPVPGPPLPGPPVPEPPVPVGGVRDSDLARPTDTAFNLNVDLAIIKCGII